MMYSGFWQKQELTQMLMEYEIIAIWIVTTTCVAMLRRLDSPVLTA
jgi:hypothetical protein